MSYKLHSDFISSVAKQLDSRLPSTSSATRHGLLTDIVFLSSAGVLPEGSTEAEQIRINGAATPPTIKPVATPLPAYRLGDVSLNRLNELKPELAQCVKLAINLTTQDFTVLQTLRTLAEQQQAVAEGHSRTMHSKHLPQSQDHGLAWAVDLGAWVNGKVDWSFDRYADIAYAMDKAATQLGFAHHVRWGCAWDRVLDDFGGSHKAYLDEAATYAKRHAGSDLIDAPHFEWVV